MAAAADDDGRRADEPGGYITDEQVLAELRALAADTKTDMARFCTYMKVESLVEISARDFPKAKAALEKKRSVP